MFALKFNPESHLTVVWVDWRTSLSIAELSTSQVDVLWHCLVCDSERSDDTLEWFLQQAQSKEFHALDASALQYIFTEKVL